MRSATAPELTVLAALNRQITWRVKIANGSGTMIDLSSWVEHVSRNEDVDQPVAGATIEFTRANGVLQTLETLRSDSTLNRLDDGITYGALVDLVRSITIEKATTPIGVLPNTDDFKLKFKGTTSTVNLASNPIAVDCRDEGGQLVDRLIETEASYGSGAGVAIQTVMQQILDAVFGSGVITLYVPVSPGFLITTYIQQKQSVADALTALAQTIGWDVRYKWDDGTSAFRLTLYEPNRVKVIPDYMFGPKDYFDVTTLELSELDIRNVIQVSYRDAGATPVARLVVTRSDSTSISRYRRRTFVIQEADTSPIDSATEANALGDAALADLKDPKADMEIIMPSFWPGELGDLYRFSANGVHFNVDTDLAVISITDDDSPGRHETKIRVRGKPAGGYLKWLGRKGSTGERPGEVGPEAKIEVYGPPSGNTWQVLYTGSGGTAPLTYQRRIDVDNVSTGTYSAPAVLGVGVTEWITVQPYFATRIYLRVIDATGLQGNADPFFLAGETPAVEKSTGLVKKGTPLATRARVTATNPTTWTVRVAVADPYPQGAASVSIATQDLGVGAATTPSSPQTVTPAASLTEAAGTYVDYTVTRPAFGAGAGRVTFTATATDRTASPDAVDVPEASILSSGVTLSIGTCLATNAGSTGPPFNQLEVAFTFSGMPAGTTFDVGYNNGVSGGVGYTTGLTSSPATFTGVTFAATPGKGSVTVIAQNAGVAIASKIKNTTYAT